MSGGNEKKQKKVRITAKNFIVTVIVVILATLISGLMLIIPGELYAQIKHSNKLEVNPVFRVQLLLSLKGYNLDFKEIDGKLGSVTKEAIKDYQQKNNLPVTGDIDDSLYERLYEDTKPILAQIEHQTYDQNQSGELNAVKEGLVKINDSLKTLSDNYSYHFITTYRDLIAVATAALGITIGLFGIWLNLYIPIFKKQITENLKNTHEKILLVSEATLCNKIFMKLSNSSYLEYAPLIKKNSTDKFFENAVNRAIWATDNAKLNAEKLGDDEKSKKDMIEHARSHLAYHFATKSLFSVVDKSSQTMALQEANRLKTLTDNISMEKGVLDKKEISYRETAIWVFILLGNDKQKELGREMLKKLLQEYLLPDLVKQNYRNIGENV